MYAPPVTLPTRADELAGATLAELQALGLESREPSINGAVFAALAAAPAKLIDGLVVRADGTNWNPGYGAGLYVYRGGAWHMLPSFVPSVIAPTLLNSWVNFGGGTHGAGYYKDPNGRVWLRGFVKDGSVDLAIFNLPAGYRPTNTLLFAAYGYEGGARTMTRVDVTPAGDVIERFAINDQLSLEGLSFLAEQ